MVNDIKIYCIGDDVEKNKVGNKAYQLFDLVKICNVPPFVCTDSEMFWSLLNLAENAELLGMLKQFFYSKQFDAVELKYIYDKIINMYVPQKIIDEIDATLSKKNIQEPYAVRSSSTLEDNAYQSGAGIFESYTDIKKEDVLNCIKKCWAAQFSEKAMGYLKNVNSVEQFQMGVIIQKYQKAVKSGVLFTVDPVNPSHGMRMEMVDGNGERFMQGEMNANEVVFCIVDRNKYNVSSQKGDEWQIELFRIGEKLRRKRGYDVDMEWVYDGEQVYILQCRPVMVISPVPAEEWLLEIDSIDSVHSQKLMALKEEDNKIYERVYVFRTCKKICIPMMKRFVFRYGEKTDLNEYVKKIEKGCREGSFFVEENKLRPIRYCSSNMLVKCLKDSITDLDNKFLTVSICQDKKGEYSALSYYDPLNRCVRIEYSKIDMKSGCDMKSGYLVPSVCLADTSGKIERWMDQEENSVEINTERVPASIRKWISIIAVNTVKLYHQFILSVLEWRICDDIPYFYDYYNEYRNIDNDVRHFETKIKKIGLSKKINGRIWKLSDSEIRELERVYNGAGNLNEKQNKLSAMITKKVTIYKEKWGMVIAAVKRPYVYLELLLLLVDGIVFKEGSFLCLFSTKLRKLVFPSEFIGEDFDKLNEGDEYII